MDLNRAVRPFVPLLSLCFALSASAQSPTPNFQGTTSDGTFLPQPRETPTKPNSDTTAKSTDSILEYQRSLAEQSKSYEGFLRTETERHQAFLQSWFGIVTWVLGLAATIFVGIVGWTHWKALSNVKKDVDNKFTGLVQKTLKVKLKEFEDHIDSSKTRVEASVTKLEARITSEKKETEDNLDTLLEYASVVAHAAVVLSLAPSTDVKETEKQNKKRREVVRRLQDLQTRVPTLRTLAIFISRLYRALGEFPTAIKFLDRTIAKRDELQMNQDSDYAALLYNKACYLNLQARRTRAGEEQENLRADAWSALQKCVQINQLDRSEAQDDEDLADLIRPPDRDWNSL